MKQELQEPCYYSILDVDASASPAAIVRAYRLLALQFHPDKNPTAPPEHFHNITQAYQVLSDPEKRRLYDHYGVALKPDLGESFAKLAPLLISYLTSFMGSSILTYGWNVSLRLTLGVEVGIVGLAGLYYCWQPSPSSSTYSFQAHQRRRQRNREVVSVSDYVTVSCMGLLLGNVSGWLTTSTIVYGRWLLSGGGRSSYLNRND